MPDRNQSLQLERVVITVGCIHHHHGSKAFGGDEITTTITRTKEKALEIGENLEQQELKLQTTENEGDKAEKEENISQLMVEQFKCTVDEIGTRPMVEQAMSYDLSAPTRRDSATREHCSTGGESVGVGHDSNVDFMEIDVDMSQDAFVVSGDVKLTLMKQPSMKTAAYLWFNTNFLTLSGQDSTQEKKKTKTLQQDLVGTEHHHHHHEEGDDVKEEIGELGELGEKLEEEEGDRTLRCIHFSKGEIEGAHRDTKHVKFSKQFSIRVYYRIVEPTVWKEYHHHHEVPSPVPVGDFVHHHQDTQQ